MAEAKTVLVVEDDPAALLLIERMLQTIGYRVVVATGPQTALARITEFQPDGIILDIHLPAMEGTELLPLLRRPGARYTPSIAITGDSDITEEEVLEKGFLQLVRKPFSIAELKEAVQSCIG